MTSSLSTNFKETKKDIDFEDAKKNIDLELEQSIEKMTRRQKRKNQQIRLCELKTQLKFDTLFDELFRNSLLRKYSIFFMRLENEDSLNREKQKTFHVVETQLVKILLENDVCFAICILVNVDTITLKQFKAHHTIVQETERAKNDDVFIAMTKFSKKNQTMHLSRNNKQLSFEEDNIKNNCFIVFININLLERLVILEYLIIQLMNQRRIISLIDRWIFDAFYKDAVKSLIDIIERLNIEIIIKALKQRYNISVLATFLNTFEINKRIDIDKFKQNVKKLTLILKITRDMIQNEVFLEKIMMLTDYMTQKNLINRVLIKYHILNDVQTQIIDAFQKEKTSIIIFNIIESDRLSFLKNFKRLLSVVSRARNELIIICNWDDLEVNDNRRTLFMLRELKQKFSSTQIYKNVDIESLQIDFMKAHNRIINEDEFFENDDSNHVENDQQSVEETKNWQNN